MQAINGYHKNGTSEKSLVRNLSKIDIDVQPRNIDAEEAFIGALLIDPDAITRIAGRLDPEDFFIKRYGWVYAAMCDLHQQGKPFDILLIEEELSKRGQLEEFGGISKLAGLMNRTMSSLYVEHYAELIFETSVKRQLLGSIGYVANILHKEKLGDLLNKAESVIFEVSSRLNKTDSGLKHIQAGLFKYYDRVEYLSQNQDKIVGLPTGLLDLDKLLGGLQRSDMVVLAGRPGMGKTSLALSIMLNTTRKWNRRVAMFSMEMSQEQLIQRLVAAESGIDSQRLKFGRIKEDEWPEFYRAIKALENVSLYIDDTPALSALELRSRARRLYAEHGLDMIVIDYMQLMNGNNRSENRTQEISFISRNIKALARELNIPILALSQLSRQVESRADKRPLLSDLRESGSIEQDADVVIFIYRDEVYNSDTEFPNIAELIVGKHRSGPTGMFSVYFKKHLTQFVDLEVRRMELEPIDDNIPSGPRQIGDGLNRWVEDQ